VEKKKGGQTPYLENHLITFGIENLRLVEIQGVYVGSFGLAFL
jgi:hypothetical protein